MATTTIKLNKEIVEQAEHYAKVEGKDLVALIENFLMQLAKKSSSKDDDAAFPEIVRSLLGAGTRIEADDINGHKAYYKHLEKKHRS